jgi:hypothetical protein
MKTTIDIPDALMARIKAKAAKENTTIKQIVVAAIQTGLATPKGGKPFKLRDCSVKGDGLRPGVDLSDWDSIREMIYEGRGG